MTPRATLFPLMLLLLMLASGCGGGPAAFSNDTVKLLLEAEPMTLDAEQVMLSLMQFDCGLRADLWEAPRPVSAEKSVATLTVNGKALNFEDEVLVRDTGYRQPYVQVRGKFVLRPTEVVNLTESAPGTMDAQTKVGVVIAHRCFANPLPLMGVRHGKFSQDAPPVFQFKLNGELWGFDRIRH
jgi:hypothetical protein